MANKNGIFGLFKKKYAYDIDSVSFTSGGRGCSDYACVKHLWHKVMARSALDYYKRISPLFTSVRNIADAFSALDLVLRDKKTGEIIRQHPILDLLAAPNGDVTQTDFLDQTCSFYIVTGNNYWQANGPVKNPPLELFVKPPQAASIDKSTEDEFAQRYTIQQSAASFAFNRERVRKRFRFYNVRNDQELWHIRKFNPDFGTGDLYGMSDLNPIYLELEQFESSNIHNLSILKRGARLSGILMSEGSITTDQYNRLKEQFQQNYQGAENAGGTLFAEGGRFTYQPLDMTNKDMDFKGLKIDIRNQIYVNLKMPLPLVSADHMTMDNYSEARLHLYESVVLPLADVILNELSIFLLPRYKDGEKFEITYDKSSITALESKMIADIERKQKSGIFADNELRNLHKAEPYEGGNRVYKPNNFTAVGDTEGEEIPDPVAEKAVFIEILKKQGFSQDKINGYVKKHYGSDS